MLRAALTVASARSLHTTTRTAAEGAFSRFNPWAKKAVVPPTPAATEAAEPKVAFNVKHYDDEEEAPLSWRDLNVSQTGDEIRATVQTIVIDNLSGVTESNWKDARLDSADLKFKIVKESIKQTGKEVSDRELNNIQTGGDLLAHFTQERSSQGSGSVQQFFQDNTTLPPNLAFRQ